MFYCKKKISLWVGRKKVEFMMICCSGLQTIFSRDLSKTDGSPLLYDLPVYTDEQLYILGWNFWSLLHFYNDTSTVKKERRKYFTFVK